MISKEFIIKLLGNSITALLTPFLIGCYNIPSLYKAIFYKEYKYYDFDISTFSDFFYYTYGQFYIIIYILSLIFFFLPFQLIKDYYITKKENLSFIKKVYIFSAIILTCILILGSFINIWIYPYWYNLLYIIFSFVLAIILTTILYYLVDIKIIKHKKSSSNG